MTIYLMKCKECKSIKNIGSNGMINIVTQKEDIFKELAATGADIVKIVTRARVPGDNIRVLGLIPIAQKIGIRIITFCMGPIGKISRIASPLFGGYLTFASLEKGEESADGQIPVTEMKKILEILSS